MLSQFQIAIAKARHICILTGAGVSAEAGIPTFRGAGGLWRTYNATDLATPGAFVRDPSLVWEFYHWRREVVAKSVPNAAHFAISEYQRKAAQEGRRVTLLTQNIDGLHMAAGSQNVVELHGSLWRICRAARNGHKDRSKLPWEDRSQPLVPALEGRGAPDPETLAADIPVADLPHDKDGVLLRPATVWFGEALETADIDAAMAAVESCDFFLTVGTSSAVHPAAGFVLQAKQAGVPIAEFNLEASEATSVCDFIFQGKAGETLPAALRVQEVVQNRINTKQYIS